MATRDSSHILKISSVVTSSATTSATVTSDAVDAAGWESLEFAVTVDAWTSGVYTFNLTECDDVAGVYTDVDATQFTEGTSWTATLKTGVAVKTVLRCQYFGYKRYVKCVGKGTSTPNAAFGVLAIQAYPHETI